ncbi:MAG: sigma-70 family RNA polymerase sigma factor [Thermoguttaceae bacterium]|jgi:RNA polymerase sigma-70 factor (ECF subfamily)
MGDTQDRHLAAGLREGSPQAWGALYDAHFDQVWRAVARLVGPRPSDIGDIVQETFLAAAQSVRGYDPARGPLRLWLAGIARNQVGAYHRRQQRQARVEKAGDLAPEVAERLAQWLNDRSPTPHEALADAESAAAVRSVLATLPEDYQTLLIERYCDALTAEQIARSEDRSAEAVRGKLVRARRAFRRAFARHSSCSDGQAGTHHES